MPHEQSEVPRVDEIMELISPSNISQNNNISANDQFRINTCYEAYQLCDTARISGSSQFLSALIQEERATPGNVINEELNKSFDRKLKKLPYFGFAALKREMKYFIDKLNRDTLAFKNVKSFKNWFHQPETISSFAHHSPRGILTTMESEDAKYFAGPWIKNFTLIGAKELSSFGKKVSNKYEEMKLLNSIAEKYNGEKIREILIKAYENMEIKRFKVLISNFSSAKSFHEKINALKKLENVK